MKIFIETISRTIINYRIFFENEWFNIFIFFNNGTGVRSLYHSFIKEDFIEIKKNSFQ